MRLFIFFYAILLCSNIRCEDMEIVREVQMANFPRIELTTESGKIISGVVDGVTASELTKLHENSIKQAIVGSELVRPQGKNGSLVFGFRKMEHNADNANEFIVYPFFDRKWYVNLYLIQKGWVGFSPYDSDMPKVYVLAHDKLKNKYDNLDKDLALINGKHDDAEALREALYNSRLLGLHSKKFIPGILHLLDDVVWRRTAISTLGFIGAEPELILPILMKHRTEDADVVLPALARYDGDAKPVVQQLIDEIRTNKNITVPLTDILNVLKAVGRLEDANINALTELSKDGQIKDANRAEIEVFLKHYFERFGGHPVQKL